MVANRYKGFTIPGKKIGELHTDLIHEQKTGRNVLARLQIGGNPSETMIGIGAHRPSWYRQGA